MEDESQLAKITRDGSKITVEQVIKDILFNSVRQSSSVKSQRSLAEPSVAEPVVEA